MLLQITVKITFLFQNRPLSVVAYTLTVVPFRLDSRLPTEPWQPQFFWNTLKAIFYKIVFAINSYFTKIKAKIDQNRISDILSFLMKKPQKDKMGTWGYNQFQNFYPVRKSFNPNTTWLVDRQIGPVLGFRFKSPIQKSRQNILGQFPKISAEKIPSHLF